MGKSSFGISGSAAILAVAMSLLIACGDSSSGSDESSVVKLEDGREVDIVYDMGRCTSEREGDTVYVAEKMTDYLCVDKKWVDIDSLGLSSAMETSSSSEEPLSSDALSGSSVESSSSIESSSGLAEGQVDPSTVVRGYVTDVRDGHVYKTVTIGTQTWMAENLNYEYTKGTYEFEGVTSNFTSWCYENKTSNCTKYGRLYLWSAAMDSVALEKNEGLICGYGSTQCAVKGNVRGVCPSGWHLPDTTEWKTLFTAVGGIQTAGTMLKSTSGWEEWEGIGNGTDTYGFTVLPSGHGIRDLGYYNEGKDAYIWSITRNGPKNAYFMRLDYYEEKGMIKSVARNVAHYVRCVED